MLLGSYLSMIVEHSWVHFVIAVIAITVGSSTSTSRERVTRLCDEN
jgi:hypothetical protein